MYYNDTIMIKHKKCCLSEYMAIYIYSRQQRKMLYGQHNGVIQLTAKANQPNIDLLDSMTKPQVK